MVKRIKKESHEQEVSRRNFILSIFILVIMVSSIVGFALMSGGSLTGNSNENPKELDFRQIEQNGQTYYVAIKNYELFVFNSVEGYDNNTNMGELAAQIKTKKNLNIYVDSGFVSSDTQYMIDKVLRGLEIESSYVTNPICDENTLILTNNESYSGNCLKFISEKGEEYQDANALVYFLVK